MALGGRTPREVYDAVRPANAKPRFEPRSRWPRQSPCAAPQARIKGRRGTKLTLVVGYLEGRRHLPVVELLSCVAQLDQKDLGPEPCLPAVEVRFIVSTPRVVSRESSISGHAVDRTAQNRCRWLRNERFELAGLLQGLAVGRGLDSCRLLDSRGCYQIERTGYRLIDSSGVSSTRPSTMD